MKSTVHILIPFDLGLELDFVGPDATAVAKEISSHPIRDLAFEGRRFADIRLAAQIYKLYPKEFNVDKFNRLLLSDKIYNAFKQGSEAKALRQIWQEELDAFRALRQKYLLY